MSQNINSHGKMSVMLISGGLIGLTGLLLAREYGMSICIQFLEQKWSTLILVSSVASLSGLLRWRYQKKLLGLFAWYINIATGFVSATMVLIQHQTPPAFGILVLMLQIGIHYSTIVAADHLLVDARTS